MTTYKHATAGHPAMREIDSLNRAFAAGQYSAEEFADAIEDAVVRHGGKRVVLKLHPNGLKKIGILSKDDVLIAEYTE